MERFLSYSHYLRDKYGASAYRVAIDAGFSCPNRGVDRERPGCSFCDQSGSLAPYQNADLPLNTEGRLINRRGRVDLVRQIEHGISFLKKRYNPGAFLLYLQAFSNTFAPVDELKELYDFCLAQHPFRELIIATRPDCIDEEVAELVSSYVNEDFDVWVELGLQSSHDATLRRIGRGHTVADFERAYQLLVEKGVKVAVHLIFGLPGETHGMIMDTVRYVSRLRPAGVKIHDLHVVRGTRLHEELIAGNFSVATRADHLNWIVRAIALLPSETVILRLTCDTPDAKLIAPETKSSKQPFIELVKKRLEQEAIRQGDAFSPID